MDPSVIFGVDAGIMFEDSIIITCINIARELLAEHMACALFVCTEKRHRRSFDMFDNTHPDKNACGCYNKTK